MTKKIKREVIINQMKQYSNDFLRENFDSELTIPIEINGRLSRALGRFASRRKDGGYIPIKVELAKSLLENEPMESILDVLKHELVHYALCKQGLPYSDGNKVFEDTLSSLGIASTNTLSALDSKKEIYKCDCQEIARNKKLKHHAIYEGSNYSCRKCGSELSYIGRRENKKLIEII